MNSLPSEKNTPSTRTLIQHPQSPDPLIAKSLQREQYIGITILLIGSVAAIGFFSRRFEEALIFGIFLSLVLIVLIFFFFFTL
jgi:hypothetical protein